MTRLYSCVLIVMVSGAIACDQSARDREKQTMSDLRIIAASAEAYAADFHVYPAARSIDELARVLEPAYIETMPRMDPWREPYRYAVRTREDGRQSYRLASAASGGQWEQSDLWKYAGGSTSKLDSDIVFGDGAFICFPGNGEK